MTRNRVYLGRRDADGLTVHTVLSRNGELIERLAELLQVCSIGCDSKANENASAARRKWGDGERNTRRPCVLADQRVPILAKAQTYQNSISRLPFVQHVGRKLQGRKAKPVPAREPCGRQ